MRADVTQEVERVAALSLEHNGIRVALVSDELIDTIGPGPYSVSLERLPSGMVDIVFSEQQTPSPRLKSS